MRIWIQRLLLVLLVCGAPLRLSAAPDDAAFDSANRLYDQGKFEEAAEAYMSLVRAGDAPLAVCFNLGNALFKSGQLGRAIAVYRLVEAVTPRDPDLQANLRFALGQVKGPTFREPPAVRLVRKVSLNEWAATAMIGFWATLLALAAAQLRPEYRKAAFRYAAVFALFTLAAGACLGASVYHSYSVDRAVVVKPEATVRRGPIDESETAFIVHDGAELRVLDTRDGWAQVTPGQGRTGWIKMTEIQTAARAR
jgi:tetratricopeptide (TPR) repeat protein